MENPHEEQQTAIMSRIINNVEKLNEAIVELNRSLQVIWFGPPEFFTNNQETNMNNMNNELISQMWANYGRNAGFYLENSGNLPRT